MGPLVDYFDALVHDQETTHMYSQVDETFEGTAHNYTTDCPPYAR